MHASLCPTFMLSMNIASVFSFVCLFVCLFVSLLMSNVLVKVSSCGYFALFWPRFDKTCLRGF